jgi:hypothetical protein
MTHQLLHIFRNNPLGRESLLQSIYFSKQANVSPVIYIPKSTKFLMYFENDVVQIDLDNSYLVSPDTSLEHAAELLEQAGMEPRFLEPKHYTASTLPDIHTNFDFMSCPRSISDLSSKIGLGFIGGRVRRIVKSAQFPVLITSPVYKEWKTIAVFFGGSVNAFNALKLGFRLRRLSGMPLNVFTLLENTTQESYEKLIADEGLEEQMGSCVNHWYFLKNRTFEENLYDVPHDALVVVGAYGHRPLRTFVFGSKMEKIQSTISNNLLIVGPNYTAAI